MKKTIFDNCTPLTPRVLMAYDNYINDYPSGRPTFKGQSSRIQYVKFGVSIYETKTQIVICALGVL